MTEEQSIINKIKDYMLLRQKAYEANNQWVRAHAIELLIDDITHEFQCDLDFMTEEHYITEEEMRLAHQYYNHLKLMLGKYFKLLEFVKGIISGDVGYTTVIESDAEDLLKELGEI